MFKPVKRFSITAAPVLAAIFSGDAAADGIVVDKVYHPYVQALETEIEWRFVAQQSEREPDTQWHALGLGRSLTERWSIELYAIARGEVGGSLAVGAYELEAKRQLTEQGEYAFDWGLLFEIERDIDANAWEYSATLLVARDFGKTTVTANLGLIYEGGEQIHNEFESVLRMQMRYRLRAEFEPSIELHVGQNTTAIGPAIGGLFRVSEGKKLRWELGVFAGVSERSPDYAVKANIEFEF